MTTTSTSTPATTCSFCGEAKNPTDTRPCAMGRSAVPPALRSFPHWLAPIEHFQYSNRCDLCLMGERHTNVQHDQRLAARGA